VDLSTWASVGTLIAGFASVGSLIAVAWQLRSLAKQTKEAARQAEASAEATRVSAYLTVASQMIEMDRFFADRPELRRHFYGRITEDGDDLEAHRVQAAAEMIIDFADNTFMHAQHMSVEVSASWKAYFEELISHSPVLREFLRDKRHWYSLPALRGLLDTTADDIETISTEDSQTSKDTQCSF
jgi:hypothetical protein